MLERSVPKVEMEDRMTRVGMGLSESAGYPTIANSIVGNDTIKAVGMPFSHTHT